MKKLFIFAVIATALASCSSEDVLVEGQDTNQGNDVAIGFSTFSNKATRAAENSTAAYSQDLFLHHANFAVWGYKNTESAKVYENQLVTGTAGTAAVYYTQAEIDAALAIINAAGYVTGTDTNAETVATKTTSDIKTPATNATWSYTPVRFWDKAATTYEFYAAAPQTTAAPMWEFCGSDDAADDAHYFKLLEAAVYGSNLSVDQNTDSYAESFKTSTDVDYMIADECPVARANFGDDVQLNFIHILSRLNVTIQTTVASPAVVTLKSLQVTGLKNVGNFSEETAATATNPGSNDRWSSQYGSYTITSKTDYTVQNVDTKNKYVLQSLIIPQDAAVEDVDLAGNASYTSPYIKIVYTIDPDGTAGTVPAETYTVYYNLAKVFGKSTGQVLAFNEGWQNTLNITIDPDEIKFTANAAIWADNQTGNLTVE